MIAQPSFQSLFIEMQFDGQNLATGTGFVVTTAKGPHLITNRHNVTGRHQETNQPISGTGGIPNEISIFHNRQGVLGQWINRKELLYIEDQPRWREHPVLGPRADFVAVPLTNLSGVELYPYVVTNPGPPILIGPAEPVSVIGFPFGIGAGGAYAVWATGFIASEPSVDFGGLPVQLVDCRTRPGQSGSPVVAYRAGGMVALESAESAVFEGPKSKLIGIYSGRINDESDLGMVWKTSAILELVQSL